jgi:hypothetical protein
MIHRIGILLNSLLQDQEVIISVIMNRDLSDIIINEEAVMLNLHAQELKKKNSKN